MKTFFKSTLSLLAVLAFAATASAATLKFDGVNDFVEISRPVSADFTIECWFRSTKTAGTDAHWYQGLGLVDGEVGGAANDFGLSFGNGKALFGTGSPDTTIRSTMV